MININKLSIIDEVLLEELYRSVRIKNAIEREQSELPKGSLQLKIIHGCECYYLQYRDGKKVCSKYIHKNDVDNIQNKILLRKQNKERLKHLEETIKKLKKALGKDLLNSISDEVII